MKKIDTLKQYINAGEVQQALAVINSDVDPADYTGYSFQTSKGMQALFVKDVLVTVLKEETSTEEMLNAALERFVGTRLNAKNDYYNCGHSYWTHDLSHFMSRIYKRGLKGWIKRLNEVAFAGANELNDSPCCERLVEDFARSAPWDAVPAEYGFTDENLRWADSVQDFLRKDVESDIKFIRQFPFESPDKCRKPHYKHEQGA